MKRAFTFLAALLMARLAIPVFAGDSLPPLVNGQAPTNLDQLWNHYDPRTEPLETQVVKEWNEGGVACRCVVFTVGTFKGKKARLAAFYAFPQGAKRLPGLLEIHGGGQSASLDGVLTDARRGYAAASINWGGNKLNFGRSQTTYGGPQTDWGALDATHPPQRNKVNHFIGGGLASDNYTLDNVASPRNSNWFLVLIAARRSITFLEQQPEVDPARIGVHGHSMGGKLTTDLAGIDVRVKAAVPSCGGSGDVLASQTDLPGCRKATLPAVELACISDNAYIPRIACPVLWLSPTNDFHAHIDNMAWNWRNVPDDRLRFSISPHLNHRHTEEHEITRYLWFEEHLKGVFTVPRTPRLVLDLKTPDGVPAVSLVADESLPVRRVDVYYSIDPHGLTRFWRDAMAERSGKQWRAVCPIMGLDQPLFVYADVLYDLPAKYRGAAPGQGDVFAVSSRVLSAGPAELREASVMVTDRADRMIDDGSRGWHDWYRLNWGHPPLWYAATRKLKDQKWRGPDGARLVFEIKCLADNTLVTTLNCNQWGAFQPAKPAADYAAVRELKGSADWQRVSVSWGSFSPRTQATPRPWRIGGQSRSSASALAGWSSRTAGR